MKYRPVNPQVGNSASNPTMTTPIIKSANADITRRYRLIKAAIDQRIDSLGLTATQTQNLINAVNASIDRWLVDGTPESLWFSTYNADAAKLGASQAVSNLSLLSEAYAAQRSIEAIVFSDAFLNRVALANIASHAQYTELSAALKSDLTDVITDAVADGKGVSATTRIIVERLNLSASKAKFYAQTEIPNVLRNARMSENDWARDVLGLNIGLLWTSTLKPTTRPWHASRHGKVYTTKEVKDFYSVNGNRYNCYCAVTDVMLDESGKPLLTNKFSGMMAKERKDWKGVQ